MPACWATARQQQPLACRAAAARQLAAVHTDPSSSPFQWQAEHSTHRSWPETPPAPEPGRPQGRGREQTLLPRATAAWRPVQQQPAGAAPVVPRQVQVPWRCMLPARQAGWQGLGAAQGGWRQAAAAAAAVAPHKASSLAAPPTASLVSRRMHCASPTCCCAATAQVGSAAALAAHRAAAGMFQLKW